MDITEEKPRRVGGVFTFILGALNLVEVKAILLMIAFAALAFFSRPGFFDLNVEIVHKFYKEKAKFVVQEVMGTESKLAQPIKAIEFAPSKNEFYSFKYTSLGFFTKSLGFLENLNQEEAEKKIASMLPRNLRAKAKNYLRSVLLICEKYQVDPLWVVSVMWTESHFRPFIKSSVGANGLMQVMPKTRKYLYQKLRSKGDFLLVEQDNFNIQDYFHFDITSKHFKKYIMKLVNIELGVLYLKKLLVSFNYNHKYATVAYNMGPGWTQRRLRKKLPVGNENIYLTKVLRAYQFLVRRI